MPRNKSEEPKKKAPKKAPRKRAKSTPVSRAKKAKRREDVEIYEGGDPTEQAWRGWRFDDWFQRPAGRCEVDRIEKSAKLTRETAVHVCRILAEGLCRYHAEGLLGLSDRAIENWIARGKRQLEDRAEWSRQAKGFETAEGAVEALGPKPGHTLHCKLVKMVAKAEAIGETTLYGALISAALRGDSKVAQWILERKYPSRYGRLAMRADIERDEDGKPKINPINELANALQSVADRLPED